MKLRPGAGLAAAAGLVLASWTVSGTAQDGPGGTTTITVSDEGRQVYEQICQACHMADAKGGGGAGAVIPALAGNANLADKTFGITVLLKGRGGMSWMTDILTPAQMAAVLTYVRSNFNAYPDPVTVADIERAATTPPPKTALCLCDGK